MSTNPKRRAKSPEKLQARSVMPSLRRNDVRFATEEHGGLRNRRCLNSAICLSKFFLSVSCLCPSVVVFCGNLCNLRILTSTDFVLIRCCCFRHRLVRICGSGLLRPFRAFEVN